MFRSLFATSRRFASVATSGKHIVIWDVETTGLDPSRDQIVELSALHPHSGEVFDVMIKPDNPMGDVVIKIHGITNEALEGKERFKEAWDKYQSWVSQFQDSDGKVLLLSHYSFSLDVPMLTTEVGRTNKPVPENWVFADTAPAIKKKVGKDQRLNMASLSKYCSLPEPTHRALSDCQNLWGVLKNLYPQDTLDSIAKFYKLQKNHRLKKRQAKPKRTTRERLPPTERWWE